MKVSILRRSNGKLMDNPICISISSEEICLSVSRAKYLWAILSETLVQVDKQMKSLDEIQGVLKC